MKVNFKIAKVSLKTLLFGCLLAVSLNGVAQLNAVTLDPALGAMKVTDLSGNQINENYIQPGQLVKLVIPVLSINANNEIPKGSCKIKIGLGSKFTIDPLMDFATINASNYFVWSASTFGGQTQITGSLNSNLPANFQQIEVAFKVLGNQIGRSTITANFLVTNHNTVTTLSDNEAANNAAFLRYEISNVTAPVAVTTLNDLAKADCSLKVNFGSSREIGLSKYQVEASNNGVDFVKIYQTNAENLASYDATISIPKDLQSTNVYVRVKSIYTNGNVSYSNTKNVSGICDGKWLIDMYPNPVKSNEVVIIRAVEGAFNGKYNITMLDMVGKVIEIKQVELNNVLNFKYNINNQASGKYMLRIINVDGTQTALLRFEKL